MTQFERYMAALNGEPADRAPLIGGWICQEDFLVKISGISVDEFWSDPEAHAIEAYKCAGADVIVQFILPKRSDTATDGSGGRATNFTRVEDRPESRFPTAESVIEYVRNQPTAEDVRKTFDKQQAYDDYLRIVQDGTRRMWPMVWIPGHVCGCPEFMWYGSFGYENYLIAMLDAPHVFNVFFEMLGERRRLQNIEVARATREHDLLRVIYCGQDICYGDGPLCSPGLLDEIYFPHLRRAFEPLNDAGLAIVWHSDGNIMSIIGQLIDAGVDGFQGLEEDHGMRLDELAAMTNRDGVPLILWGSVSVTSTFPHGSVQDMRADIERCLDIGARRGRLFLAPSSSVGPEVPTENIEEFFTHGREYGNQVYGAARRA